MSSSTMAIVRITPSMRWAGLAAFVGGLTAIVMTPPFATAFFLAYPREDALPFWFNSVEPRLDTLLTFSSRDRVYETYGRIYNLVYVLFLPLVLAVHHVHDQAPNRLEKRGYVVLVAGSVATTVGVAGDYWANGIGFPIEVLGLLAMIVGVIMYGLALHRSKVVPQGWAWMFLACGPGALVSMGLIGHIPSGPTLPFAVVWLVVGSMLLLSKGISTD